MELPTIRAASDCYALAVKVDARLLVSIQQNTLANLITEKTADCRFSAPAPAVVSVTRTPSECLKAVRQSLQGKVYDQDKIVGVMIELCRPEIEAAARTAYLQAPTSTSDAERQKEAAGAISEAKLIVAAP